MSTVKGILSIAIVFLALSCRSATIAGDGNASGASYAAPTVQPLSGARLKGQQGTEQAAPRRVSSDARQGDPKLDPRRKLRELLIHRDETWDYSFMWPGHWHRHQIKGLTGTVYAPGDDARTGFYLFVRDIGDELEGPVTAAYVADQQKQAIAELDDLPNGEILEQAWITKGTGIGFEILFTFRREGETCKRLMRVLYKDRTRYVIYEQGASLYEYEVFYDIFEFMYSTFTFGDLLAIPGLFPPD